MSLIRVGAELRVFRAIEAKQPMLQIFIAATWIVLLCGVLVRCQEPTAQAWVNKANISSANRPTSQVKQLANTKSIGAQLKSGMAYADLRKSVIAAGWSPIIDSACKANVVGEDHEIFCATHPELDSCKVCNDLPELSACSGDAYCGMSFSKGSQRLHVATYGDFGDRYVTGDRSQLSVTGWDLSRAASSNDSATPLSSNRQVCLGKDFPTFLRVFAADDHAREQYTMPVVFVTDWKNPNETSEGTIKKPVPRQQYRDFSLKYINGAFHEINSAGDVDSAVEDVQIQQKGANYFVRYTYGMSEGNSWLFKARNHCWYLAEDPEPSDP